MIKKIELTVMDTQNKKVLRRYRIKPPLRLLHKGVETAESNDFQVKTVFTPEGAEEALSQLIGKIDEANPNHRYRLVDLGRGKFKLVWDEAIKTPEEERASDEFRAKILST